MLALFSCFCCRPIKCAHCPATFMKQGYLRKHMPTHVKDYCFACHICGRKFTRKFVLDKHIRTHQQHRGFPCNVCPQNFLTAEGLRNHVGVHTGERPYKCGLCPMAFKFSGASSVHRRSKHMVDGNYHCEKCLFTHASFPLFKSHLLVCTPDVIVHWNGILFFYFVLRWTLSFILILATFPRLYTLQLVSIVPSNRHSILFPCFRPFACQLCSAEFTRNDFYKRHLLVHNNEYPYSCSICKRNFKRKYDRDRHVDSHSQIRKFNCPYCEQHFLHSRGLKNHIGVHTGEQAFKCGLCARAFKFSGSASVHRRTHMVLGRYQCKSCGFLQTGFKMFVAHLRSCAPHLLIERQL